MENRIFRSLARLVKTATKETPRRNHKRTKAAFARFNSASGKAARSDPAQRELDDRSTRPRPTSGHRGLEKKPNLARGLPRNGCRKSIRTVAARPRFRTPGRRRTAAHSHSRNLPQQSAAEGRRNGNSPAAGSNSIGHRLPLKLRRYRSHQQIGKQPPRANSTRLPGQRAEATHGPLERHSNTSPSRPSAPMPR